MPCTPATVQVAAKGKVEAAALENADVWECTDEAVEPPKFSGGLVAAAGGDCTICKAA